MLLILDLLLTNVHRQLTFLKHSLIELPLRKACAKLQLTIKSGFIMVEPDLFWESFGNGDYDVLGGVEGDCREGNVSMGVAEQHGA